MYQGVPGCIRVYQGVSGCNRVYQDVPVCIRVYQGVPGCNKDVSFVKFYYSSKLVEQTKYNVNTIKKL